MPHEERVRNMRMFCLMEELAHQGLLGFLYLGR
jgi:hypothetical protein